MINSIEKIRRSVGFIGESEPVLEVLNIISQVAVTDITVLIGGESGSGKEIIAQAIHKNSKRKFESLITVNCAAIPSGIIESELFGHKKGSFTGAHETRKGYFESADKGTIFLDEIGELPLETQAKLLRVIEQGEFIKVGGTKSEKVDVRVVAATNRNLTDEVKNGNFRQDLYYRIKTITINSPSLRERLSDLHLFIERFGLEFCAKNNIIFKGFNSESQQAMRRYSWPGNIRELKNVIESLIVMNRGQRITEEMVNSTLNLGIDKQNPNLPININANSDKVERELILKQLLILRQDVSEIKQLIFNDMGIQHSQEDITDSALFLPPKEKEYKSIKDGQVSGLNEEAIGEMSMEEIESEMIERTLDKFKGNRRKAAEVLNISERTLYRKINEYEIKK